MNLKGSRKLLPPISWCIYGWASDTFPILITTFIFSTYFIEHIATDKIIGTYQWAYASAIAGIIIAVLGPILGAIADQRGHHKRWLGFFTVSCILSTALLWFAYPSHAYIHYALIFSIIGTASFEIALIFYNAFLPRLAKPSHIGRLSGLSWGSGYLGGIVALAVMLLIAVVMKPAWLNAATFEQIRIVGPFGALWFAVFCLPLFFFIPDTPLKKVTIWQSLSKGLKELRSTCRELAREKNILYYLVARMIYNDGLNTLFAFGGIFAVGTYHFTFTEVLIFGITLNVLAGIGAIALGWVDDRLGAKPTILISLGFLTLFSVALLLTESQVWFWLMACLVSIFIGPTQSASRSLMTHLTPANKTSEFFGLYALTGRITAFIGPWLLGYATMHFQSQRAGMATIVIFFIIGWIFLMKVRIAKSQQRR